MAHWKKNSTLYGSTMYIKNSESCMYSVNITYAEDYRNIYM